MQIIVFSVLFVLLVVGTLIYGFVERRRVAQMTKESLVKRCKELINEGKFDKLKMTLLRHPKLLLTYFNELQTELTEYAREVESRSEIKNN